MNNEKYALVTGGAGGLGGATTDLLVKKGWHVFAADFDQQALDALAGKHGISPILLDVTDPGSVQEALEKISMQVTSLDAIINFAGILAIGSMIEMDEQVMQRVLDVNVMGTFRVNKAFFPLLKENRGRIINISSETGWQSGGPFNGAYGSSKHAIEAYSDSLRRELSLLDMHVVKIQPGPFKTGMVGSIRSNFDKAAENSTYFRDVLSKVGNLAAKEEQKSNDPAILAKAVYEALAVKKPKAAYSVKPDSGRSFLERLPTSWADGIMKKVLSS